MRLEFFTFMSTNGIHPFCGCVGCDMAIEFVVIISH